MNRNIISYFTLILIVLGSTFLVWLPFLLRIERWFGLEILQSNMQYLYRNYDGPLYIVPAKTFYNPKAISKLGIELPLSEKYFAAHLPFYPFLIRVFSFIGYLKAMLLVNLLSTVFLACFFYFLLTKFKITKNPLLLSTILLFHPKFLVVRSIGAPESLFLFFVLVSLYFFEKEKYLLAGLFGGLSVWTKSPGILLFGAYGLIFLVKMIKEKKFSWRWLFILLIPFSLFLLFCFYFIQYQDFFAYFNSGDNLHLYGLYSVFNFRRNWIGTPWIEDIILYFFLYGLTAVYLKENKHQSFFYYSIIFFMAIIFVAHRDIPRYSLPLWPMALIAFEKFFTSKKFIIVFLILLPAVYLFAWNFIIYNVMPIANWAPYL